jgi:O-antigen/teichoic acid export membrane protein
MRTSRKALRDLAWSAVSTGANVVSGIVLILLVGNWLKLSELGGYSLATTIYLLAGTLAAAGTHVAVVVYGARCAGDRPAFDRLTTAALGLALVLGVAGGVLLWLATPLAAAFLSAGSLRATLPTIAAALPVLLLNKVLLGLLNSVRHMRAFALCTVGRHASLMLFTLGALAADWGLEGVVLAFPAAEVVTLCLLVLCSRGLFRLAVAGAREWLWRVLWLGGRSLVATLVSQLAQRVDIMLVAHFSGEAAVGMYSVAALVAGGPAVVLSAFQRLTTPMMSSYHAASNASRMGELGSFLGRAAALFTSLFGALLSLFYPELIRVLYPGKPELAAAADACRVLLLGHLLYGSVVPCGGLFTSAERPALAAATSTVALVGSVVLGVLLVPRFGVLGAAQAASVGRVAGVVVFLLLASWALGVRLWSGTLVVLWLAGGAVIALGFLPLSLPWRIVAAALAVLATAGLGLGALRRDGPPEAPATRA